MVSGRNGALADRGERERPGGFDATDRQEPSGVLAAWTEALRKRIDLQTSPAGERPLYADEMLIAPRVCRDELPASFTDSAELEIRNRK